MARRPRYSVDLVALQAVGEQNYHRLARLFGSSFESKDLSELRLGLSSAQHFDIVCLRVLERCPYTSFVQLQQEANIGGGLSLPTMQIRIYHDVCMAEVVACGSLRNASSRYEYPNKMMLQMDEKTQQNRFLANFLSHCLSIGHRIDTISM